MDLKEELFQYLWSDLKIAKFLNWLYNQDSIRFEELIGKDVYLDIISEDFSKKSIRQIKRFFYDKLSDELKTDWGKFIEDKYMPLIGVCKISKSLDYNKPDIRDWELKVGDKYEIIEIVNSSGKNDNHKQYVRYVARDIDLSPSGFVPRELFDIDFEYISDIYLVHETDKGIEIRPKEWTDGVYRPTQYSFWEDFYNDETKAVKTYYDTLDKLGIKNAW